MRKASEEEIADLVDFTITSLYGKTAYWRPRDGITHLVISGTEDTVCETEMGDEEEIGFNRNPPAEGTEVCDMCYGIWEICLAELKIKREDKVIAVKL